MSMDGNQTVINPLAVGEFEQPGQVVVHKGPKVLEDKDLAEYAAATGLTVIKLKSMSQGAVLGELAQKLGTERLGNAMLVKGEDMILEAIKECGSMVQDYAHEPQVVGTLMKVKLGLIDQWNKSAHTLIKSKRDSHVEEPNQRPQNIPPPPLVPVQINIHGNQVSSPETVP